jgi:hypothetical protein
MPKPAAAGFKESRTLLPEWRPIPTQEMARRTVRWESIKLSTDDNPQRAIQQTECPGHDSVTEIFNYLR